MTANSPHSVCTPSGGSTSTQIQVDRNAAFRYDLRVASFTVGINDPLWAPVVETYSKVTAQVKDAKIPDHEIEVSFAVRGVAPAGEAMPEFPGKVKSVLVVDTTDGHPIHTAALAYAAEKGGMKNLGRAAIKVIGFRLNNMPKPIPVAG